VICVRELEPFLPRHVLAQVACCIEATIPFRPRDKETGQSRMDKLHERLVKVNEDFALGLSHDEQIKAVQRAAELSNADVLGFASDDVLEFLDNTWSLLSESNKSLKRHFRYTTKQFQRSLFGMYNFLKYLPLEVIFDQYQNVPAPEISHQRNLKAKYNLQVARRYLAAKLLSVSILVAIAELRVGDASIAKFVGDLPIRHF
jgi:hypothetical protein